jgi:hypothetical protein
MQAEIQGSLMTGPEQFSMDEKIGELSLSLSVSLNLNLSQRMIERVRGRYELTVVLWHSG